MRICFCLLLILTCHTARDDPNTTLTEFYNRLWGNVFSMSDFTMKVKKNSANEENWISLTETWAWSNKCFFFFCLSVCFDYVSPWPVSYLQLSSVFCWIPCCPTIGDFFVFDCLCSEWQSENILIKTMYNVQVISNSKMYCINSPLWLFPIERDWIFLSY